MATSRGLSPGSVARAAVACLAVVLASRVTPAQAAQAPDLAQYGYRHVLATVHLQPGQTARITVPDAYSAGKAMGYATITVPAGAFTVPVKFEVLAGSHQHWQALAPKGLVAIANFAYRVTDTATGQRIAAFHAAVTYSVRDAMVAKDSVYWATTATSPAKFLDASPHTAIDGDVLTHPQMTANVGWVITTPKADLMKSPSM
ncbi:MAG TPA: hypothetical protein VNJ51_06365 [Candidatus Dormibacteraeota bacterium]|nr:hypothetical protein [Candidatus Dormibacteraeota bacterium]